MDLFKNMHIYRLASSVYPKKAALAKGGIVTKIFIYLVPFITRAVDVMMQREI